MSSRNRDTRPRGGRGTFDPFDIFGRTSDTLREGFDHLRDVADRAREPGYSFEEWGEDLVRCSALWWRGVGDLFWGWASPGGGDLIHDLAWVVDYAAEAADPKVVHIHGFVDRDSTIRYQLRAVKNGAVFDDKVYAALDGDRLSVGLQDLIKNPYLVAGHYAGIVYADEVGGAKRPLAHLYVTRLDKPT